jgi:hypothetical protein
MTQRRRVGTVVAAAVVVVTAAIGVVVLGSSMPQREGPTRSTSYGGELVVHGYLMRGGTVPSP